jgi:hypothetical protein
VLPQQVNPPEEVFLLMTVAGAEKIFESFVE